MPKKSATSRVKAQSKSKPKSSAPASKAAKAPKAKAAAAAKVTKKVAPKPAASKSAKPAGAANPAGRPKTTKPSAPPVPPADSKAKAAPDDASKKVARKGITIVSNKPARKPREKPKAPAMPEMGGGLLSGGLPRKPLIPSGPSAKPPEQLVTAHVGEPPKSPFNKKELARFRMILLQKRAELVGDVSGIEREALLAGSGSLSHLPQHMAEQGSEAADQDVSLNIAAADRRLIREIDSAISRVDGGTYGICELTGKPIHPQRLEELPWARFSIEAAREMERRTRSL